MILVLVDDIHPALAADMAEAAGQLHDRLTAIVAASGLRDPDAIEAIAMEDDEVRRCVGTIAVCEAMGEMVRDGDLVPHPGKLGCWLLPAANDDVADAT